MDRKASKQNSLKSGISQTKLFRFLIVVWLFITTIALLFITDDGLTAIDIVLSIILTSVAGYLFYYRIPFFEKKYLSLVPYIMKIACLSWLMMIVGHLGVAYVVFFLIIIIDTSDFKLRDFSIVLAMIFASMVFVWRIHNDAPNDHTELEKSLLMGLPYLVIAAGVITRLFARESLNVGRQKKALEISWENLKIEQDEMVALLNNMENAIISLDKDDKIYFANKIAQKVFPIFNSKKVEKVSLNELLFVDTTGRQITLREIVKNSNKTPYRNDLKIKSGEKLLNLNVLVTKIFGDNKRYRGAMISLHNLTSDEILEQSKVAFASLASHEIRTPLTVIEGYLFLLLTNKDFKYNDLTKQYLTVIHDSTTDLIKLANDVLSMSKIDEGTVRVSIEKTDLEQLVKETVSEQLKLAKLKNLGIDITLNKVPNIETDNIKVREILRNLISNAIKFSVKGSISVQLDQDGDEITISVEDSGIGIPDDSKDKIFSKFYQVENWETRKTTGSGLGLYVSKSLAKRIGGDLILESSSNKGSKFNLVLPVKYPNADDLKIREDSQLKEFIKGF